MTVMPLGFRALVACKEVLGLPEAAAGLLLDSEVPQPLPVILTQPIFDSYMSLVGRRDLAAAACGVLQWPQVAA